MKPFINIGNDIKEATTQIKRSSRKNDRETIMKTFKEYENIDKVCEETIFEHGLRPFTREYQGKRSNLMTQLEVVVKVLCICENEKGNVIKVSFGDTTGLSIKRDDPRRRSFKSIKHNCDNPGPKTKSEILAMLSMGKTKVNN